MQLVFSWLGVRHVLMNMLKFEQQMEHGHKFNLMYGFSIHIS
jgi:hypothetical protein